MSRGERRRRKRAGVDSYFQSVSASSIDSRSESAHCEDESCRHGPADCECCRYEVSGFLREQPRGNIGVLGGASRFRANLASSRRKLIWLERLRNSKAPKLHRWRPPAPSKAPAVIRQALQPRPGEETFLILKAVVDVTGRAEVAAAGQR